MHQTEVEERKGRIFHHENEMKKNDHLVVLNESIHNIYYLYKKKILHKDQLNYFER